MPPQIFKPIHFINAIRDSLPENVAQKRFVKQTSRAYPSNHRIGKYFIEKYNGYFLQDLSTLSLTCRLTVIDGPKELMGIN